jgi:hypothetical protein
VMLTNRSPASPASRFERNLSWLPGEINFSREFQRVVERVDFPDSPFG